MTLGGSAVSAFPFGMIVASIASFSLFAVWPSVWTGLFIFAVIYVAPPVAFRIHSIVAPLKEGVTRLEGNKYSAWRGAQQIQAFYEALPLLESLLRLLPGWYSMWLRLWGSRVGHGVHWTEPVEIVDRSMMVIGNHVVFGRKVECRAHVIRVTAEGQAAKLLVRKIRIGNNSFIGAGARLLPGAIVPAHARVPADARIGVNETFGGQASPITQEEAEMAGE